MEDEKQIETKKEVGTKKSLYKSLHSALKKINAAHKESMGHFNNKYADLNSILDACRGHLLENDIIIMQPLGRDKEGDYVKTLLIHVPTGEEISCKQYLLLKSQDMQQAGSAISYARRYSLQALLCIPTEDDDAEVAMDRPKETVKTTEVPVGQKCECKDCGASITKAELGFSMNNFGAPVCRTCQKVRREAKAEDLKVTEENVE